MYELEQGDQTTLPGTEGGDPEIPPLAPYQAWERDWEAESTTTAEREEDEIDAGLGLMTARNEERRHQEEILGNVAKNLKSNKLDAEQSKAVSTPPARAQPTINDENNAPTIAFIMAQMEVLQAKLAQMQAQSPLAQVAESKSAQAARRPNTPPPPTFPFNTGKPGKAAIGKKEAATADLASGPPTSIQDEATKPVTNSAIESKGKARVVAPGHQNG